MLQKLKIHYPNLDKPEPKRFEYNFAEKSKNLNITRLMYRFNAPHIPVLLLVILLSLCISCGRSSEEKNEEKTLIEQDFDIEEEFGELTEVKAIFYDMYSPVKAHRLYQQLNVIFDPSILNPVDNLVRYNSSNKVAVNLGIYGADMSYCHMFGQTQEALNYLSAVYRLAERLGIASTFIDQAANASDRSLNHPDSLFDIASNIYIAAEKQLQDSERTGAASLILAGGWIEALYIAITFYDEQNPVSNLEEQILTQKYSLDRLVALLSNHQDNEFIAKYLLMIRQLKRIYDRIEILFDQDDLHIDTSEKTIESDEPKFIYSENDITEIVNLVKIIRQDMIN